MGLRTVVLGAGAVGGWFGGRLAASGADVSFLVRGRTLEVLRRDGLTLLSGDAPAMVLPVPVVTDPHDLGPVDVVLLCVKTWQVADAISTVRPLVGPGTAVLTLQNGVEAPHQVAEAVGRSAVLPGVARVFAGLEAPGRVRHAGGPGSLTFAEFDGGSSPRVAAVRELFDRAGVPVDVPTDIWAQLWTKFLFVAPFGGLGALLDLPIGELRARPGTRALLAEAMTEVARIAHASGVQLPEDAVDRALAYVDRQEAEGTSSLHRDLRDGRPSELADWTGAIVRLGERTGTPTPVNATVYEALRLRADLP